MSHVIRKHRRPAGFTLLELVVVVGVLVVLAGLVLPNLDIFKGKADKGVSASNMADLSGQILKFYSMKNCYPDHWDSLLTSSGVLWTASSTTGNGLSSDLVGGPVPGAATVLVAGTIPDNNYLRSLSQNGITTVLDLDSTSTDIPSNRFTVSRTLAASGAIATINASDSKGQMVISQVYPQQTNPSTPVVPTGKMLVVMGVGKLNDLGKKCVQEIPLYSDVDVTQWYGRYLAVFEVNSNGDPARLVGVIGADGSLKVNQIISFYKS